MRGNTLGRNTFVLGICVLAILLSPSWVDADTINLYPTSYCEIRGQAGSTGSNDCTNTQLYEQGSAGSDFWRGISQFTLPAATSSETISGLTFSFRAVDGGCAFSDPRVQVNTLSRDVTSGVTWDKYDGTNNWTTPGGDVENSFTTHDVTAGNTYNTDITSAETWGAKIGILLKLNPENDGSAICSDQDVLTVTYSSATTSSSTENFEYMVDTNYILIFGFSLTGFLGALYFFYNVSKK